MTKRSSIFFTAFLDGFTGAGLFRRLRLPGAPSELIDSRGVAAIYNSGEFESIKHRLLGAVETRAAYDSQSAQKAIVNDRSSTSRTAQ
jgi:hypothetical protein